MAAVRDVTAARKPLNQKKQLRQNHQPGIRSCRGTCFNETINFSLTNLNQLKIFAADLQGKPLQNRRCTRSCNQERKSKRTTGWQENRHPADETAREGGQ